MAAVDISPANDGGVLKEIIKEGIGDETPSTGSKVKVHYTGTLLDGTKFDSSRDRYEPFEFDLGRRTVIKAWDIGVATMKKGEIALLTCDPKYAYGQGGSPPKIPPNTTLKFEIEMIDWKGEDLSPGKDGGIERFQITAGKDSVNPAEGALVDVHLTGKYNDQVFEDKDIQFSLGEGESLGIIEGVEIALESFTTGEKSKLKIKSKYAFKTNGNSELNIPPNADLEYIVELKKFEKAVKAWSLSASESVEQAKLLKQKGTSYFTEKKYNLAIKMYKRILTFLEKEDDFHGDLKEEKNSLVLTTHLNLALCYLKTDQNLEAKDACNEALKMDPKNTKALFRRGQAHLGLAAPDTAIKDFQEFRALSPKGSNIGIDQINTCKKLMQAYVAKEKKLYANMFDKFAQEDKEKEEAKLRQQSDVMRGTLGEWGQEERPGGRDATAFEKENPNILMLNANGTGEFQNM